MEFLKDFFILIGRVLISLVFLWGAFEKIKHWPETQNYMKSKHVPQLRVVLPVSVGMQILGGLLVFFGWFAHFGAFLLLIVALSSAFWMHSFWRVSDEKERRTEKLIFLKELGIIGGVLLVLALGAGHFGVN